MAMAQTGCERFARTPSAATVLTLAPIGITARSKQSSRLWFEYGKGRFAACAFANIAGRASPTRMKA